MDRKARVNMAKPVNILVTFDVDGTLIESEGDDANRMHKEAFSHGFKEVFGLDTSIDVVKHHGCTDPLIIQAVLEHHQIPKDEVEKHFEQVKRSMISHALESADKDASFASKGIRALPGVADLLEMLHQPSRSRNLNVIIALCTGNLEPIGWLKMESLGLKPFFTAPALGGFGSDYWGKDVARPSEDRAQLLRIARDKAEASLKRRGATPTPSSDGDTDFAGLTNIVRHVHVGDSPFDIKAAELANAIPLGVTTGVFSEEELREVSSNPANIKVLESLSNGEEILSFILDGL